VQAVLAQLVYQEDMLPVIAQTVVAHCLGFYVTVAPRSEGEQLLVMLFRHTPDFFLMTVEGGFDLCD
jgi:hypothetical protein